MLGRQRTHLNDRNRSIPLERFAELLSVPELDFISVQKDVDERRRRSCASTAFKLGQEFTDFADTAAVVAMLDLLISVDTSVAHLAGAMGKAVALLLPFSPDFRWLLDRTDSPWYPTMRLFRQSAIGDWETRFIACGKSWPLSPAGLPSGCDLRSDQSTRLTASGLPSFGRGVTVRPDAP